MKYLLLIIVSILLLYLSSHSIESFSDAENSCTNDMVSLLNDMYKSDVGVVFRALERCNEFYDNEESKQYCIEKEIDGPHGGDPSIESASTTWLRDDMIEAHFYSDINFNNTNFDVYLLFHGNQKKQCDFIQDAGFNGCGKTVPCTGDSDKLALEYLDSCQPEDYKIPCNNPTICNFTDQELLVKTYNTIIQKIKEEGSKYKDIPIKEPQRQVFWDQGTENGGKYEPPIAVGFLYDVKNPQRVTASKNLAKDFRDAVVKKYNNLNLPLVQIYRNDNFKISFKSYWDELPKDVTCHKDMSFPSCITTSECGKFLVENGCNGIISAKGCNNGICQYQSV